MDDLTRELRGLRKGRGLTPARLQECPTVIELLNAGTTAEAYDKLVHILNEMGDDLKARALRNAYGLDAYKTDHLTTRREDFAINERRHSDTIEAYENAMIDELATQLETAVAVPLEIASMTIFMHDLLITKVVIGSPSARTLTSEGDGVPEAYYCNLSDKPTRLLVEAVYFGTPPAGLHIDCYADITKWLFSIDPSPVIAPIHTGNNITIELERLVPGEFIAVRPLEQHPGWFKAP